MSYTPRRASDYNRAMIRALPALTLTVALAGCTGAETAAPAAGAPETPPRSMPKPVPDVPPAVLARLYEEVERESGVSRDRIELVRAESATWNDGALGCPQPNQAYAQMIVQGWWVILRAGREEYDYRIDHNQRHRRCTGATKQPPIVYPRDT